MNPLHDPPYEYIGFEQSATTHYQAPTKHHDGQNPDHESGILGFVRTKDTNNRDNPL